MTLVSRAAAVAFASLFLMGTAFAQAPAAAPAAPAVPAAKASPAAKAEAKPKAERTAASLACSSEADSKNIHGKERKKFMSKCKHDAAAKPKT